MLWSEVFIEGKEYGSLQLLTSNISLSFRDFFLVHSTFWTMAEKMESALFGYFCLPYTSSSVDYSRHCNFEIFSWFDLFVFPRDMDDYRGCIVDDTALHHNCNGYPEKRPVWHSLFCRRDIGNYIFLCFYIFLGFDQKCFLSSSKPKTEKVAFLASFFGALRFSVRSALNPASQRPSAQQINCPIEKSVIV